MRAGPPPIDVLDGFVAVLDYMGSDAKPLMGARVSTGASGSLTRDERLRRFLLANWHTAPFEHNVVTLNVRCPRFVRDHWFRHRTQSYSEESARYRVIRDHWYVPAAEIIGVQGTSNKQARMIETPTEQHQWDRAQAIEQTLRETMAATYQTYQTLLVAQQTPREVARLILPHGMYTEFWATANLKNLLDFLRLRDAPDAQYETRLYAIAVRHHLETLFPETMRAWNALAV